MQERVLMWEALSAGYEQLISIGQDVGSDQTPEFAGLFIGNGISNSSYEYGLDGIVEVLGTVDAVAFKGNGWAITDLNPSSIIDLTSANIRDESITSADIGENSIGSSELMADAVEGGHIMDRSITNADIALTIEPDQSDGILFQKLYITSQDIRSL